MKLHIDIETYSDIDLLKTNVTKYTSSPNFAIMMIAYAINEKPVKIIDLMARSTYKDTAELEELLNMIKDPKVKKVAHNYQFELTCLHTFFGIPFNPEEWECTMYMASCLNLPQALGQLGVKLPEGRNLIQYFCKPCKPTKTNGHRTRNLPEHAPEKWETFLEYCKQDVKAEREVYNKLSWVYDSLPPIEEDIRILDGKINHAGVAIDMKLVDNAVHYDENFKENIKVSMHGISGLANPNSHVQVKKWIEEKEGFYPEKLDKANIDIVIEECQDKNVKKLLELRKLLGKTSTSKFNWAKNANVNGRLHNLFALQKAHTGRWAGYGLQPHNLPRNKLENLDAIRNNFIEGSISPYSENIPTYLSQLVRTMIIPVEPRKFYIVDYSAIEARVLAWVAGEQWLLEEFKGDGKIYEAMASKMYGVPPQLVDQNQRQDGKTAILACGYQGSIGAIKAFQRDWDDEKCQEIVTLFRNNNPEIVGLWGMFQKMAETVIAGGKKLQYKIPETNVYIKMFKEKGFFIIQLPNKRRLYYYKPSIDLGRKGFDSIFYTGVNQVTKKVEQIETYGGKLVENVIQAISRDILALAMVKLDRAGYTIRLHIHDEVVLEGVFIDIDIKLIKDIMCENESWNKGLPLAVEGFESKYYRKD